MNEKHEKEIIKYKFFFQGTKLYMGNYTGMNEFPWIAHLQYKNKELSCIGSLISSRYILTSASCVSFPQDIPQKHL